MACAHALAAEDERIKVFPFEKGERNGEAHRDTVLRQASGRLVAQIADDDLWFPNHLQEVGRLLTQHHFGNLPQPLMRPDGLLSVVFGDLGRAPTRNSMLDSAWNVFGPSFAGYRMKTYLALAQGWSPAPPEVASDLFMWRKFLSHPGIVCGTRVAVTGIHLSSESRAQMSLEARAAETKALAEEMAGVLHRDMISQRVLRAISSPNPRPFEPPEG